MKDRHDWTLPAFLLVVLFGGINIVAIRVSNRELPPLWGAAVRFLGASVVLFLLTLLKRIPLPRGAAFAGAVVYGLLAFGGGYALIYWGLLRLSAGIGSIILALTPLVTFLLALAHGIESFRLRGLIGAMLGLGGILIIFRESDRSTIPMASLIALLVATACIAEATVMIKSLRWGHHVSFNAVAMSFGAVMLLASSAILGERWGLPTRAPTWGTLVYFWLLGSSLQFVLYLFVLSHWSPSSISYQFVLFPLVALVLSGWLEGETLTLRLVVGASLVLLGVALGMIRGRQVLSI